MATDLSSQITQAAGDPASAAVDGQTVQSRPIADLIAADQYLAQKQAASLRHRGLRFTRLVGPAQCPAIPPCYPPI